MSTAFTIDGARDRITAIVRRLVLGKVTRTGSVKAAIRDLSRETKISPTWLERAHWSERTFAPLLHRYDALVAALEAELSRQKANLAQDQETLKRLKRENNAVSAADIGNLRAPVGVRVGRSANRN